MSGTKITVVSVIAAVCLVSGIQAQTSCAFANNNVSGCYDQYINNSMCAYQGNTGLCVTCSPSQQCIADPPDDSPCISNPATLGCQSAGYSCSNYTNKALCNSIKGQRRLRYCAWNDNAAKCMPCGNFTADDCPLPTCSVNGSGVCTSNVDVCAQASDEDTCNDKSSSSCYFDTSSTRCFYCGSLTTMAFCNGQTKCSWSTTEGFCHAAAAKKGDSDDEKLKLTLGASIGGGGVALIIIALIVYCAVRRDNKISDVPEPIPKMDVLLTMPTRLFVAANENAMALQAPALFQEGRVQRLKLLGRGANGSVYSCVLPDGSIIAMKEVLLPQGSNADAEDAVANVMKEVGIVSSLDHANIVRFYGSAVEKEENRLTIFMELVPSGSMASMVRGMSEPMQEDVARVYTRQLVSALSYLHERGVVHRDLKCDNLLLTAEGKVKLTDFGASKVVGMGTMATRGAQTMIGTPFFMAPEILLCGDEDGDSGYGRRADIWSLGITLLEMLECGKIPWPSFPSTGAAFMYIANPGSLPDIAPRLSEDAKSFITLCCNRDPLQRPTAAALLLHPWIANVTTAEKQTADIPVDGSTL